MAVFILVTLFELLPAIVKNRIDTAIVVSYYLLPQIFVLSDSSDCIGGHTDQPRNADQDERNSCGESGRRKPVSIRAAADSYGIGTVWGDLYWHCLGRSILFRILCCRTRTSGRTNSGTSSRDAHLNQPIETLSGNGSPGPRIAFTTTTIDRPVVLQRPITFPSYEVGEAHQLD